MPDLNHHPNNHPDLLFHGTNIPRKIERSGVLERARLGYKCVSLTRSFRVAQYFASLSRSPEEDEELCGIYVFSRSRLIQLGYELVPFHDPLFGDAAYDEEEEQVWNDIPLKPENYLRLHLFSPIKGIKLNCVGDRARTPIPA